MKNLITILVISSLFSLTAFAGKRFKADLVSNHIISHYYISDFLDDIQVGNKGESKVVRFKYRTKTTNISLRKADFIIINEVNNGDVITVNAELIDDRSTKVEFSFTDRGEEMSTLRDASHIQGYFDNGEEVYGQFEAYLEQ